MLRFLHIADLHLGMRITRFRPEVASKIREARFQALENVGRELRDPAHGYQFLVVAGDLFDDENVSASAARRAYQLLESFHLPVLVISGNHDPLQDGTVWDHSPWKDAAAHGSQPIRLLRERAPLEILTGVTVFPCPVFRKTSTENPLAWIGEHPRQQGDGYRLAIAHGSVLDRPNLPEDDHPIPLSAPTDLQLDYVALGHWHNPKTFADAAGQERMAYSGVHEPMRFAGETESAGWLAYAPAGTRDEFIDRGPGTALRVTLTEPKAPPDVQVVQVGHFKWEQQPASVSSADDLARLISDVAQRPDQERTLLKLRLTGTIPLEAVSRIVDLREILDRYVVGEMDEQQLHVAPTDEEIREEIGSGLLKIVYERLLAQRADPDPQRAAVAAESVRLLYELVNSLR